MSDKPVVPANKLAGVYIKIRNKRADLRKAYEADDAHLEAQLDVVVGEMLATCEAVGASSIRTDAGTIIRTIKTRYWSSDWEAMHDFIQTNAAFDLLERRIHQTNMKSYLEGNPDKLPPGLNSDSFYDISVRRST